MNKRWLVLLAPLGLVVGGFTGASAEPAPPAPTADVPAEEIALARAQFDAALSANGIDPATVRLVMCNSEYDRDPDLGVGLVRSMCYGMVGAHPWFETDPRPMRVGTTTIHFEDGTLSTALSELDITESIGEVLNGEPTAPITVPV
jgi:hypothetical protein